MIGIYRQKMMKKNQSQKNTSINEKEKHATTFIDRNIFLKK
jgi:hypothetical protein